jgi:hypothetical protein
VRDLIGNSISEFFNNIRVKRPSRIAGRAVTFGGRWNRLWAKARALSCLDAPADQGLFFGVALVASAVMSSAFRADDWIRWPDVVR